MSRHHAKNGSKRYAYYVCLRHQKEGASACPGSRVPTGELERFVFDRIRTIGRDPELLEATVAADREARESRRPELVAEEKRIASERGKLDRERRNLVDAVARSGTGKVQTMTRRVSRLTVAIGELDYQLAQVRTEIEALDSGALDVEDLRQTLDDLEPIWAVLFPEEQVRLLDLLIERIEFDGAAGDVAITFRPGGPQAVQAEASR